MIEGKKNFAKNQKCKEKPQLRATLTEINGCLSTVN